MHRHQQHRQQQALPEKNHSAILGKTKTTASTKKTQRAKSQLSHKLTCALPPKYWEGGFSTVRAHHASVVKTFNPNEEHAFLLWKNEVEALHACRTIANVPRLLTCRCDLKRSAFTIKMTRCAGHPLDYLYESSAIAIDDALILTIAYHTLLILRDMHALSICHYDIKLENIMYHVPHALVSLIDFGFCKRGLLTSYKGTEHYVAPEILDASIPFPKGGPPCDIYALGCVLYYLMCMANHCYNPSGSPTRSFPWSTTASPRIAFLSLAIKQMLGHAEERPNAAALASRCAEFLRNSPF